MQGGSSKSRAIAASFEIGWAPTYRDHVKSPSGWTAASTCLTSADKSRLAYVWTLDGRLLNLDLIAGGYANEYTYSDSTPYRYQRLFRAAEASAAERERGLWDPTTCAAQR